MLESETANSSDRLRFKHTGLLSSTLGVAVEGREYGIFSTAERSDRGEKYFLVTAVFSRVFFSQVSSHQFLFTRTVLSQTTNPDITDFEGFFAGKRSQA